MYHSPWETICTNILDRRNYRDILKLKFDQTKELTMISTIFLSQNGRSTLGDSIYKSITDEYFDPEQFLMGIDLSSEHKILDLKNKMEASIVIWKRKLIQKDNKSSWSSTVSVEKRGIFEERAETILLLLKHRYPGIPQSTLDISKIQFNGVRAC